MILKQLFIAAERKGEKELHLSWGIVYTIKMNIVNYLAARCAISRYLPRSFSRKPFLTLDFSPLEAIACRLPFWKQFLFVFLPLASTQPIYSTPINFFS